MFYSIFYSSLIHLPSFLPFPFFISTFLISFHFVFVPSFILISLLLYFPLFLPYFILIFPHSQFSLFSFSATLTSLYYFITYSCFISLVFLFSCDISRKATSTFILRDHWTNVYRTVCRRTYSTENCHALRCSVRLTLPSLHNLSFSFINWWRSLHSSHFQIDLFLRDVLRVIEHHQISFWLNFHLFILNYLKLS